MVAKALKRVLFCLPFIIDLSNKMEFCSFFLFMSCIIYSMQKYHVMSIALIMVGLHSSITSQFTIGV